MNEQQGPPREYPSPPEPGSQRPVPVATPYTPAPGPAPAPPVGLQGSAPAGLPGPWAVPQQVGPPTLGRAGWALGLGIASVVFGLASLLNLLGLLLTVPLGTLAIAFGVSGQRRIAASGGALTGRGLALAGWICGVVGLALPLAVFLAFFTIGFAIGITRSLLGA